MHLKPFQAILDNVFSPFLSGYSITKIYPTFFKSIARWICADRILLHQGTDDVRHTAAGDPGGGGGGEPLQPGHSLLLIRRVGTCQVMLVTAHNPVQV